MKYLGSKLLETKRLELRPQTMNEQKYLWNVLMKPDINRYFLSVPKKIAERIKDWDIQGKYLEERMKHALDKDVFEWSIFLKENNECIGRINCFCKETNENIRDIGWIIDTPYQKNGYAYEAACSMLDYMFNECDIEKIETSAAIVNPASWKLMEKIGFQRTGETKNNNYLFVEEPVESYCYFITKDMFNKRS